MRDPGYRRLSGKWGLVLLSVLLVLGLLLFFYGAELWALIVRFFNFLSEFTISINFVYYKYWRNSRTKWYRLYFF